MITVHVFFYIKGKKFSGGTFKNERYSKMV